MRLKKPFLLLLLSLSLAVHSYGQTQPPVNPQTPGISSGGISQSAPANVQLSPKEAIRAGAVLLPPARQDKGVVIILTFLPLLIFLVLLIMFGGKIRQIDFRNAFSENTSTRLYVENKQYDADKLLGLIRDINAPQVSGAAASSGVSPAVLSNLATLFPPTVQVSQTPGSAAAEFRPSASRLIAFLTGLMLLVTVLSITCFFIYFYLCTGSVPGLEKLSGVLIALGIGMAPYAVNKIASASTGKDKTI